MHDYQRARVLTFLNPEADPLGRGYHIIQSKIAIGSGGVYGKGWLGSTQSELDFARKFDRFYFCGLRGRVWFIRLRQFIGVVFADYQPLFIYRIASQRHLQPFIGRQFGVHLFCVCVCEYRHGDWRVARRRRTIAASKLRRHVDCDIVCGFRNFDVDSHPQKVKTLLKLLHRNFLH